MKYKEWQKREERYYTFILMDMQMPVMDGLRATELIRKFETEVCRVAIERSEKEGGIAGHLKTELLRPVVGDGREGVREKV